MGDIFIGHQIAKRGGHPLDRVFGARKTGASWKAIAADAKVDDALLAQDLVAAFPKLAPPAPRPVVAPPPSKSSEKSVEKNSARDDSETRRREEESREFIRGDRRR